MATDGKPVKGILKHTSSLDKHDNPSALGVEGRRPGMKWDEMNILATHHPANKDYGHMKIDEPPTPYSKYSDPEDDDGEGERRGSIGKGDVLDPSVIAAKLTESQEAELAREESLDTEGSDEEDDLKFESPEDQEHRKAFELKRKIHYNEFQAVQLAKKLMAEEEEDEDEDEQKESVEMDNDSRESKPVEDSGN
ncbi:protein phosphatase inhibitor 2-like [Haliotis rubra]|uniref:protein phosphatase inhibitor 2-like n=1 Tax=Haliotis rubra TaxID=36100 RepID=UPI001EE54D93|nr:protein phosphatase inhibitor 2-like [Haliotis rubra]